MPTAVVIGAGPAGLTAALELIRNTNYTVEVFEADTAPGGLSRTVARGDDRFDIGGHRFFTKSKRVRDFWLSLLPLEGKAPDAESFLIRKRKSRILYEQKLFDYPLSLTPSTLKKLGIIRAGKILLSYIASTLRPEKNEKNLENFLINRFGSHLYKTFFKSYTEKVWGMPATSIDPAWGAQRIRGLSLFGALKNALIVERNPETSLIETFWYPAKGPGQIWDCATEEIKKKAEVHFGFRAVHMAVKEKRIDNIEFVERQTGRVIKRSPDAVISTIPIPELISSLSPAAPGNVLAAASGLQFRDFITVAVMTSRNGFDLTDNWIYVQDTNLRLGRVQIYPNWSSHLSKRKDKIWFGLEYFCQKDEELWSRSDEELAIFAFEELSKTGLLDNRQKMEEYHIIRTEKAYPAYNGSYGDFPAIVAFLNELENLFPVGRNGMHRYNNADHSCLAAMTAVDFLRGENISRSDIWSVNTEQEYHEKA